MKEKKPIKCPMKVEEVFPYGKVLVPDIEKLKQGITLSDEIILLEEKEVVTTKKLRECLDEVKEKLFDWVGGVDSNLDDCHAIEEMFRQTFGGELN